MQLSGHYSPLPIQTQSVPLHLSTNAPKRGVSVADTACHDTFTTSISRFGVSAAPPQFAFTPSQLLPTWLGNTLLRKGTLPIALMATLLFEKGSIDQKKEPLKWHPDWLKGLIAWHLLRQPEGGVTMFGLYVLGSSLYQAGKQHKEGGDQTQLAHNMLSTSIPMLCGGLLGTMPIHMMQERDDHADVLALRRLVAPAKRQDMWLRLEEAFDTLALVHRKRNVLSPVLLGPVRTYFTELRQSLLQYEQFRQEAWIKSISATKQALAKHRVNQPVLSLEEKRHYQQSVQELQALLSRVQTSLRFPTWAFPLKNIYENQRTQEALKQSLQSGILEGKYALPPEVKTQLKQLISQLTHPSEGLSHFPEWYSPEGPLKLTHEIFKKRDRLYESLLNVSPQVYQELSTQLYPEVYEHFARLRQELSLQNASWLKLNQYNPFFAYLIMSQLIGPPATTLISHTLKPLMAQWKATHPKVHIPALIHSPSAPKASSPAKPWYEMNFTDMTNTLGSGPYMFGSAGK
ncbi:MAG: hypothetical protein ACKO37_05310 [Vampirovibrionales bacterium]